uniref:hypothetical protein n=1 Tax=Pseudomonas viridiflava TaxID=33069 RepID=UPI0019825021
SQLGISPPSRLSLKLLGFELSKFTDGERQKIINEMSHLYPSTNELKLMKKVNQTLLDSQN